jgi:L-rhamnose-H+ transport protein
MDPSIEMSANPSIGVMLYALGGLAGAVFYLPFKRVRSWAWESYWMIYAVFGLLFVPWGLAFFVSPNLVPVLKASPGSTLFWCYLFGAMWGVGGLTWGLMIRYLGVGLGLALGCGICAATGTLIPPIFKGEFPALLTSTSGIATLIGVAVSLIGIVAVGSAGMSKENELPEDKKRVAVAEFHFKKGLIVAIFSGIMSAGMSFGLGGGAAIEKLALEIQPAGSAAWKGIPVLVVVLMGGFTINFLWCLYLNLKNKTIGDYMKAEIPLLANLIFAGMAGAIWCSQFICFKVADTKIGAYSFAGWTVLMSSAIFFSALLGIWLGEWRGVSRRTRRLLGVGLAVLVVSLVIIGYGNYLKG